MTIPQRILFFDTTFSLEDAANPVEYLLIKLETIPAPAITPADFIKNFLLLFIMFHFKKIVGYYFKTVDF